MRKNKVGSVQNGFSIFALDDDTTISAALKAYFESNGYEVDTESDPLRAIERMREKPYDILLLDFLMTPIRGDEVVTRIRRFNTDLFIILLTGHKELAPPLDTIRELDIQGYYEKSERFDQLELLVESCVKAIRQMHVIRNYRDGLKNVLLANEEINMLCPMDEMMGKILAQAQLLSGVTDSFIYLDEPSPAAYLGTGVYSLSVDDFVRTAYNDLHPGRITAQQQNKAVLSGKSLLIPLTDSAGIPLGILGLTSDSPLSDTSVQLLSLFGRQANAALQNARLHEIVQQKNKDLEKAYAQLHDSYLETITTLRLLVDAKDIYTRGHSDRTSIYAVALATALGCDSKVIERVRVSGLFHDVGKIGTADAILNKSGRLDDKEYSEIKQHPLRGAKIIASLSMFNELADIISAHHERYDGNGYPHRLKAENIPYEARIIAVTDAFDAMTSGRNYGGRNYQNALDELRNNRNTQFDGSIVDVFLDLLDSKGNEIKDSIEWTYRNDTAASE
jgi:putative nucleotidyltransferase with HDIG domain